jgi:hypothetical protein
MNRIISSLKSKIELLYLSLILIFLVIINYRVLDTWFIVDDTANIFCSSFDTIRLLFDRGTYLFSNQLFFTPLLPISFKVDWLLFKLNPAGYHLHNLVIAFLGCLMFYKFQRLYFSPFFSWIGAVVLAFSLPVSFDIGWITRKHYLWGFSLVLTALYLFKMWEVNKKNHILFFSFVSTLLSFLFKEAYAFLPAVIFLVSSGSLKERAKKAIPYFLILAVYLVWRIYMLGSIGGYPGSAEKSFYFLLNKLALMPMVLSENLFGFSFLPFVLLIIVAFLDFKMLIFLSTISVIVVSPFIFFPEGGFLLANKALSFVAVIAFTMSFIMYKVSLKYKKLSLFAGLFLFIPVLFISVSRAMDAQEGIIRLSDNYERASGELIEKGAEKILIIGNYSYYFSNLEDIYKNMLKTDLPFIKSISDIIVLPYLGTNDFDKVILANNFDLNPDAASLSTIEVIKGTEAKHFITKNVEKLKRKSHLPAPEVSFTLEKDHLRIDISDSREGTYLRCLHMGSYVGCYHIPREYIFKFNKIKKVDEVDIIYISKDGIMSEPAIFKGLTVPEYGKQIEYKHLLLI